MSSHLPKNKARLDLSSVETIYKSNRLGLFLGQVVSRQSRRSELKSKLFLECNYLEDLCAKKKKWKKNHLAEILHLGDTLTRGSFCIFFQNLVAWPAIFEYFNCKSGQLGEELCSFSFISFSFFFLALGYNLEHKEEL